MLMGLVQADIDKDLSHRITRWLSCSLLTTDAFTLSDGRYPSLSSFPTGIITRPLIILG